MRITKDDSLLHAQPYRRGIDLSLADVNTLRRAELTLQKWFEVECGSSNQYSAWAIERDDDGDGLPYMVTHHYAPGSTYNSDRRRIPDREAGARKRIAEVCARNGLHFYVQGDPRGCALYVSTEPFADFNYTAGIACCVN